MNDMSNTPGKPKALLVEWMRGLNDAQFQLVRGNPQGAIGRSGHAAGDISAAADVVAAEREAAKSEALKRAVNDPEAPHVNVTPAPASVDKLTTSRAVPVIVTYARAVNPCGAKHVSVGPDAKLSKHVEKVGPGQMATVSTSLWDTLNATTHDYFIAQVPKGCQPGSGAFDYGTGETASFARRSSFFEYRHGLEGVATFDNDPKGEDCAYPAIPYMGGAALRDALAEACPAILDAHAVTTPSSSCGDYYVNGILVGQGRGTHLRVAIKNMADWPRALKVLGQRLMLKGHLYAFVTKNGTLHFRTIIDLALADAARPVFSCAPVLAPGIELRNRPGPELYEGSYLDTEAAIPDLTSEERKQLKALQERLQSRTEVEKLMGGKRDAFVAANPAWARSATAVRTSSKGYPVYQLCGDEPVYLEDGRVVASREIAGANSSFAGMTCRDLIEPDYGNDTVAVIYDGQIFSWAHGGIIYRLPSLPPPNCAADYKVEEAERLFGVLETAIASGNSDDAYHAAQLAFDYRFATVDIGPKNFVLDREQALRDGHGVRLRQGFTDSNARYHFKDGKADVQSAAWWLRFGGTVPYKGITLAPNGKMPGGVPIPPGFYNYWQGWAVKPNENGSLDIFRDYLRNVLARGLPARERWLLRYMAQLVQQPWNKPEHAVVLLGKHGAGKSKFGQILRWLLPDTMTFQTANFADITGQFTGSTAGKIVGQLDEATWLGERRMMSPLKNLISAPFEKMETKGVNSVWVPSYCRLIFTSNENQALPIEPGERRYSVFQLSDVRAKDRKYFGGLDREMREGGGLGRLLHELQQFDIGDGHIAAYDNAELASHMLGTLDAVGAWLYGLLLDGALLWDASGAAYAQPTTTAHEAFLVKHRETASHWPVERFSKSLRKYITVERRQVTQSGARPWCLIAKPLAEARAEFAAKAGGAIDWHAGGAAERPEWLI